MVLYTIAGFLRCLTEPYWRVESTGTASLSLAFSLLPALSGPTPCSSLINLALHYTNLHSQAIGHQGLQHHRWRAHTGPRPLFNGTSIGYHYCQTPTKKNSISLGRTPPPLSLTPPPPPPDSFFCQKMQVSDGKAESGGTWYRPELYEKLIWATQGKVEHVECAFTVSA